MAKLITIVNRILFFFIAHIFVFCTIHSMLEQYADSDFTSHFKKVDSFSSFFDELPIPTIDIEKIGRSLIARSIVAGGISAASVALDMYAERFFKNSFIKMQSKTYRVTKGLLLSLCCYPLGKSWLIPGILLDECVRHYKIDPLQDNFDYKEFFLGSFANIMSYGGVVEIVKYISPVLVWADFNILAFLLAKLEFFGNKSFAHESWLLRLTQVFFWFWDHGSEPLVYRIYLEERKQDDIVKKYVSFLILFSTISSIKYFYIYKILFFEKKNLIYEDFYPKSWFFIELISKAVIPIITDQEWLGQDYDMFVQNVGIDETLKCYIPTVISIFFCKLLALHLQHFQTKKKYKRYFKEFNEVRKISSNFYKKFHI